jgi:hypothetical protein
MHHAFLYLTEVLSLRRVFDITLCDACDDWEAVQEATRAFNRKEIVHEVIGYTL